MNDGEHPVSVMASQERRITACWRRAPEVLWRRSGDRVVLLGSNVDEPLMLDGCGPEIWQLLSEPMSSEELVLALQDVYDESLDTLRPEVTDFLDQLAAIGVVRPPSSIPPNSPPT